MLRAVLEAARSGGSCVDPDWGKMRWALARLGLVVDVEELQELYGGGAS